MTQKIISFEAEGINYIAPTWDEMQDLAFNMSKKIVAGGEKFDRIITLAKGGWPMTRSLVDFLQVDKVASIGVEFYGGINKRLKEPTLYQELPISVKGENVLLFDDVSDSGKSLEFTINYLREKEVGEITVATLFYKSQSSIKPDYYGAETSSWIMFPYDVAEGVRILGKKWLKLGIEEDEIKDRYKKLGFKKNLIEYYFFNKGAK